MGAERSPFLAPEGPARRRRLARRARKRAPSATLAASGSAVWSLRIDHRRSAQARWRLRLPTAALLALIVPVAILAALLLEGSASGSGRPGGALLAIRGSINLAKPAALSPAGLQLGTPALKLAGVGDQRADAVRQRFAEPPRAGLLFNLRTGAVLWQEHPYLRAPIASLTKMMTALLTVEDSSPATRVLITRQAVEMPGSRVGVLPLGKWVDVEPLLYGLLLPSGNDAAVALAQHVGGSLSGFVTLMNAEAARLGLGCTRYSNPSGYYDQGNFSCAADLAVLAYDDLAQPRLARIMASASAILPFPIKGGKLYLYNNNPLLMYGYQGADGVKTGYTEAAGTCLVGSAERDGVRLGVVLLHSPAPGTQAQRLLDDGFEQVYHQRHRREAIIPGGA
ncbi:MAG TPA: hypothetical protein VKU89_01630 [Solirubrobacteraceae bacterium]|nr:hypothetical protein [Solirubrobacteraceae bacterium]